MQRIPIHPAGLLTHWDSSEAEDSDASETPAVPTVVQNLLQVYKREVETIADLKTARLTSLQSVRRTFREFFQTETQQIFAFLESPLSVSPTLQTTKQLLQKYGSSSFQPTRVKIRDLPLDTDCTEILTALNSVLKQIPTDNPFNDWISQTNLLLTIWRTSVTELGVAEKALEKTLAAFQTAYQKARTLLDLPPSPDYESLVNATEQYLRTLFAEQNLEPVFSEYCRILKQVVVLTDAIQAIRALTNTPVEPLCSVCLLCPVTTTLVPCGHTFCSTCGQRQSLSCYICRQPVREVMKIYLS